jgi:hypothetical protein
MKEITLNINPAVDAWLARYDNPQKATVQAVRKILLEADKRIGECIKWQSPTFTYEGNLASFNPKSKKHASLMFHTGAHIPGNFPNLQGGGGTARFMQFESLADVAERKAELVGIVKAWCASRASSGKAVTKTAKKVAAKAKNVAARAAARKLPAKRTAKKVPTRAKKK